MLSQSSPITSLYMIATGYAKRLEKLGIKTIGDLLYHLPYRYEDYSLVSKISLLQEGEKVSVVGEIIKINNLRTKFGKNIQVAVLADETGKIELVWYNQPYLPNVLRKGTKVTVAGEVKWFDRKLVFESPDYEIDKKYETRLIHTARLVPVYPETQGVSSKWLRSRIDTLLYKINPQIPEFLPQSVLSRFQLISEKQALYQVHFPKNYQEVQRGRNRLGFDELLILQLAAAIRKKEWQKVKTQNKFEISLYKDKLKKFTEELPFKLTSAQKRAVSDILTDLAKTTPMNRLLEGDVGSGKTVVAAIAIYLSYLNGYTSILMAPTEILSRQHFQTLENLFKPLKIGVKLIVSGWKDEKRKYPVYVGTHALLSEKFSVDNLGLAVIDEQQRFGVELRAKLRRLGNSPHVLTMTATPIPRTIALTLLSDLDLSVLDELPKGRVKIKTWVVPPVKRLAAYEWIRKQITSKIRQQAFIICPFIEPSESLNSVKAAKSEYEKIQKDIFPDLKVGLLHGKMK
ncbi:DEAD/DEAH box helicase [Candidatus Microgenomates bacterium]|nr:DEAD/DEAH box helicase [Candidatus Microgenomates bacterium]